MDIFGLSFITFMTIFGIIAFSIILIVMFKTKHRKELHLSLLMVIIFLIIRLTLQFIEDTSAKFYLYLHVVSLLVISLALIRLILIVIISYFLQNNQKIYVPKIMQDLLQIGIFILVSIIILREHLKLDTSILVTSSVLSIVIGLALQDTLGNFFSGLAMQMQRPFEQGDWININDKFGQVIEVDWRAIKICTLDKDVIIVPNSELSKVTFINYSKPTKLHRIVIPMGVSYTAPPNHVKSIIMNILEEEPEVLSTPAPSVVLISYGDFSINYEIRVFTETFNRFKEITDSIYTKIWYHFKRNNIIIPYPIRDVYLHEVTQEAELDKINRLINTLKTVDFLDALSQQALEKLAKSVKIERFASGETVIKQGEEGDTFYFITEGEVEVSIKDENGSMVPLNKLSKKAFFGELSLLTGSLRTATVITTLDSEFITISSESFKSIIMENPKVASLISNIITNRQMELDKSSHMMPSDELASEIEEKSSNLLIKMKRFFGF